MTKPLLLIVIWNENVLSRPKLKKIISSILLMRTNRLNKLRS